MSERFKPFPSLGDEQALAADPAVHAALSASAGTGKTQVLTARVLRLLLQGARPESILCLTFTKAAAAEMANRIGARLAAGCGSGQGAQEGTVRVAGEGRSANAGARAAAVCPRARLPRRAQDPDDPRLRAVAARRLPGRSGDHARVSSRSKGSAEQELVRRTLADLMADAEAQGDERLIRDVQSLSRRLGEAGAVDYLQALRPQIGSDHVAGPARESRADDPLADESARGIG